MKIREEINRFSAGEDKPVLLWLLDRYHWASQWSFVAACTHRRCGSNSYETNRIWAPTSEGRVLYTQAELLEALKGVETIYTEYMALRPPVGDALDMCMDVVRKARAALAKAKGE